MINKKQQGGRSLHKNPSGVMGVLKELTMIPISVLLFALAIFLYSSVLMLKRPPERLYAERSAQPDFCPFDDIPEKMKEYVLWIEDHRFYEHRGFIWSAIKDAARLNFQSKEIVTGGSTITQQLAKNLYFRFDKSYLRKAAELVISAALERRLGKRKILELYLNIIYYGSGIYGISDAAQFYFNKDVRDLSINQMFILSCIPCAPTAGNPIQHPEIFEQIRDLKIISCMRKNMDPHDIEIIHSYHADLLDPELRKNDCFTENFSQVPVMTNERFGPFTFDSYSKNSDSY